MVLEGTVLAGREFEPVEGRVVVENGVIQRVERDTVTSDDIVLPAFVNAHTHVGDSIAKEAGAGLSLEELVAPPDGLKHRLLRDADREELVGAMARSLEFMRAGGTGAFVEFREGGVAGVEAIHEALAGIDIEAVVLGRGTVDAMAAADGFGASGARDGDFDRERNAARDAGKPFGIHAGERDPADINAALDLDPDFLVHMVHAEALHLDRVEERGTPIAVCPRSNLVTGVGTPPIGDLLERTTVALGTDNVMLNAPSMFREMAYTAKTFGLDSGTVLRMATTAGAEAVGLDCGVIEPGRRAALLVLNAGSDNLAGVADPIDAVVRRATALDVERVAS